MQAITTCGWGFRPRLCVTERPAPEPGPNDVLVQVHASSVNPKDVKLNYQLARVLTPVGVRYTPPLFGDDLSGTVVFCGENVSDFVAGDAVYGMDMRLRTAALAEQAVIDQRRVAKIPASLDFASAASMPLAALTALQGLRRGQAGAGAEVLIIGASGGVGTFAVQLARHLACRVTAVCSGRNTDLVRGLGADRIIDYTKEDYRKQAGSFDLVFDVTSYETPGSIASLRKPKGWFISTGGHGAAILQTFLSRDKRARLIKVESWREDLEELARLVDDGHLQPVIDSQFPLVESEAAYQRSRSGRARGKVVINVRGSNGVASV